MKKSQKKESQVNVVLRHFKRYGRITSMQAFQLYQITRLSAIVFTLRESGLKIKTEMITRRSGRYGYVHYGLYRIVV